jgi:pyridoxine 5'-phosphate synthase PdxJ
VVIAWLKELPKLVQTQPGIADNAAHCEGVDWIVARNRKDSRSVRRDDVRTLTENAKASLFQCYYSPQVVDSQQLGHGLSDPIR